MDDIVLACVQPATAIYTTRDEFEHAIRRYLRQPHARSAHLVVFPELMGILLAPSMISPVKRRVIKRAHRGRRPTAGFVTRRLGRVADATAGMLGGGLRGSVVRIVTRKGTALQDAYIETFGALAREFGTAILAGSTYVHDEESGTLRHRAYLFGSEGEVLGYQDKLNLAPDEADLATPGTCLEVIDGRFGKLGILIGRDVLYPELARLLALQGADVIVGIAASPGAAQAGMIRSALALRAEENQVFVAASFMLGPNYLDVDNAEDYFGQSAVLAPISLTEKGDGVLVQAGSIRTEAVVSAKLEAATLVNLRETGRFRPRQHMNLAQLGPALAEWYQQGLSLEQAVEQQLVSPALPLEEPPAFQRILVPEPLPPLAEEPPATPEPQAEPDLVEPIPETSISEPAAPEARSLSDRDEEAPDWPE